VLLSYGAGNIPSRRKDILDEIAKAIKRDCLVVNISQCLKGCVAADYENGKVLQKWELIIHLD
jgi:lysophospholipase